MKAGARDGPGGWPREILDEIRARSDIAAIAGERVALKRAGASLKGLCPFHDEKTPSFHVNPARGLYKCFGCGEGGDVFALVMRLDGLSFPEAVRALADRTGVKLPAKKSDEGLTRREMTRGLLERAADYFHRYLFSREGSKVLAYLHSRGVHDDTARTWRLGAAPSGLSIVYNKTHGRYPDEVIEASGLFARGRSGGWIDRFRGRLIFPVCDASGRIVGFGGRLIDGEGPKYLNSPETEVFRKGEVLFGLHLGRDAIRRAGRAVLVEGYLDVVLCHQDGIAEAVAPLGTAFTEAQARLVKRYADGIVFALDADAAGAGAADRGIDVALGAGLEVRVATFAPAAGGGKADPADLVAGGRGADLRAAIESAAEYVAWRLEAAAGKAEAEGGGPAARAAAARALVPTIARVADPIVRAAHARATAQRLGVDEEVLRREVERSARAPTAGPAAAPSPAAAPVGGDPSAEAEAALLRLCLDGGPEVRGLAAAVLAPTDFSEGARGRLFAAILEAAAAGEPLRGDLGGRLDAEAVGLLAGISVCEAPPATVEEAAARIERVKDRALEAQIRAAGEDLERVRALQRARALLRERLAGLARAARATKA